MARISLLFTLALVLAIGSVLAHPPTHKKTKKTLCPPTLSGLKTFPFFEISKLLDKEAKNAPNTIHFQTLFAICRGYNEDLREFEIHPDTDVVKVIQAKYNAMTTAMLKAEAFIGIEGELSVKLRKNYGAMAEGFVMVVEKVGAFSASYKFKADAKISVSDKAEMEKCVIKLRGAIRAFLKVIHECNKKYSGNKIGYGIGNGNFIGFAKKSVGHAGKLIGLDGHGQVGAGLAGLAGLDVGVKAGVHAGAKANAKAGAHAGGHIGGLFGGFLGFGGKAQFDAAGKAHIGGGNGFRPLSKPHGKHLN